MNNVISRMWIYILLLLLLTFKLGFFMRDGRWFFFDDFAAFRYIADRSYLEIIKNSFVEASVDYHKFLGYLVLKGIYENFGVEYRPYLVANFLVHTINTFLVFGVLSSLTKNKWVSVVLAGVFGWKFFYDWPSNLHDMLAGTWYLSALVVWIQYIKSQFSNPKPQLSIMKLIFIYFLGLATKSTAISLPITLFLITFIWVPVKSWKEVLGKLGVLALIKSAGLLSVKRLGILGILGIGYVAYFGRYFLEGRHEGTGYVTEFSPATFVNSQLEFWGFVQLGVLGILVLWAVWKKKREVLVLFACYLAAIAPMSFFKAHASTYYIYIPLVFILMALGYLSKNLGKLGWIGVLGVVIILLNPFKDLRQVITKYRHPEYVGFDEKNMEKLVGLTKIAIAEGKSEFYFSDWEMSPNLYSAVYHNGLGIFLGGGEYEQYEYDYDRERESVVIRDRH